MIRKRPRSKFWQLFRRVPAKYAKIETRKFIWWSTETLDKNLAEKSAKEKWANMILAWEKELK